MLTAYEQQRLENINKNKEILKQLNLDQYQDDKSPPVKHREHKVIKKRSKMTEGPIRKSSRKFACPDEQTQSPEEVHEPDTKLKTFEEYFEQDVISQAIHVTGFYQGKSCSSRMAGTKYNR